jgi:hypothetical protein
MTATDFTSLAACKERLTRAVDQFVLKMHAKQGGMGEYAGDWSVESTDDRLLLVWTCEEADPRAQAMGPDVPAGFQNSGISCDAPWTLWGGNEIIAAAEIGEYDDHHSGSDSYQQFGVNMVTQWVSWSF